MTAMKNIRLDLPSAPVVMITPADPQPSNGRRNKARLQICRRGGNDANVLP